MRIVAYLVMLLAAASLLLWLAVAPMSLMALDSGGSLMGYAFIGAMAAYPIWVIAWLRAAWRNVGERSGAATLYAALGAAPALLLTAAVTLGSMNQAKPKKTATEPPAVAAITLAA